MKRGVRILGVEFFEVEFFGVLFVAGSMWSSTERRGERDRDGEWNCDGGAEMGGVCGVDASLGVVGMENASWNSLIFFFLLFELSLSSSLLLVVLFYLVFHTNHTYSWVCVYIGLACKNKQS